MQLICRRQKGLLQALIISLVLLRLPACSRCCCVNPLLLAFTPRSVHTGKMYLINMQLDHGDSVLSFV